MRLRESRKNRRLSQRELADMSGLNFRSLQDYEQGHKKLSSASGDVVLRLTTVLGCSAEELITGDSFAGAAVCPQNSLSPLRIQAERFYCARRLSGSCRKTGIKPLPTYRDISFIVKV